MKLWCLGSYMLFCDLERALISHAYLSPFLQFLDIFGQSEAHISRFFKTKLKNFFRVLELRHWCLSLGLTCLPDAFLDTGYFLALISEHMHTYV